MAAATKVELEKNRFFRILLRFLRLQVNHNLTTVNMRDSRPRRRPRRRFYDWRALILRAGNGAGIYGGSVALSSTKSWRSVLEDEHFRLLTQQAGKGGNEGGIFGRGRLSCAALSRRVCMTIHRCWIAREWLYFLGGLVWAFAVSPRGRLLGRLR